MSSNARRARTVVPTLAALAASRAAFAAAAAATAASTGGATGSLNTTRHSLWIEANDPWLSPEKAEPPTAWPSNARCAGRPSPQRPTHFASAASALRFEANLSATDSSPNTATTASILSLTTFSVVLRNNGEHARLRVVRRACFRQHELRSDYRCRHLKENEKRSRLACCSLQ